MPDLSFQKFRHHIITGAAQLGVHISSDMAGKMEHYARHLLLWNEKINITAIKDPLEIAEKHFVDSIAALGFFSSGQKVMDMGSGGGFPGIPLKIMNPLLQIFLVDASRKKISFLKDVIRILDLKDIEAVHARVEDFHDDPDWIESFDGVISRAFSDLNSFVNLAQPFIKKEGCIHAMKGRISEEKPNQAVKLQFDIQIKRYELPFEKSERHIVTFTRKA